MPGMTIGGECNSFQRMGIFYRLLVPKSVHRARRKLSRAAHPVRTARRAATPKSFKKVKRVAWKVANPMSATKQAGENAVVNAVRRGGSRRRSQPTHVKA